MLSRTSRGLLGGSLAYSRPLTTTAIGRFPAVAEVSQATASSKYPITKVISIQTSKPPIDRSQTPLTLQIPLPHVTSEPYSITRTPSKGLPVYELRKGGGTLKLTRVRKIAGEKDVLKKQLEKVLVPKPEYVRINPLTGHIIIKVSLRYVTFWYHNVSCASLTTIVGILQEPNRRILERKRLLIACTTAKPASSLVQRREDRRQWWTR